MGTITPDQSDLQYGDTVTFTYDNTDAPKGKESDTVVLQGVQNGRVVYENNMTVEQATGAGAVLDGTVPGYHVGDWVSGAAEMTVYVTRYKGGGGSHYHYTTQTAVMAFHVDA